MMQQTLTCPQHWTSSFTLCSCLLVYNSLYILISITAACDCHCLIFFFIELDIIFWRHLQAQAQEVFSMQRKSLIVFFIFDMKNLNSLLLFKNVKSNMDSCDNWKCFIVFCFILIQIRQSKPDDFSLSICLASGSGSQSGVWPALKGTWSCNFRFHYIFILVPIAGKLHWFLMLFLCSLSIFSVI